jgi:hypothetical protein
VLLLGSGYRKAFGQPLRRLCFHPILRFEAGLEFVALLNRAIWPLSFYFPMVAIFANDTKIGVSAVMLSTHTT